MKKLKTEEEIYNLIKDNEMAVVYFTGNSCSACEAIKIKLEEIIRKFPKIQSGEINGEENINLAVKFEVYSVPIFLLYIEGKESLRIGRNVDLLDLERNIERYYEMIFC